MAVLPGSVNLKSGLSIPRGSASLKVGFSVRQFYRTPDDIDTGAWGGILCIDPNRLRPTDPKGPIYFLLDSIDIRPGLTSKSGVCTGTINDNKNGIRPYDMMLMPTNVPGTTPGSDYIRDNDEFWIGVQEGPAPGGLPNTWTLGAGGRYWLMGGYICKRYYKYDGKTTITAIFEGKCYMDVWMDQKFGTLTIPRNYTTATDFATIAADIIADINAEQNADYGYATHPVFWPGSGTTPATLDIKWTKEFKNEDPFKIMKTACEEAGWEWQIVPYPAGATPNDRRAVMLYPRAVVGSPEAAQSLIEYDRNVRDAPKLVMGDTTELVTDLIMTDGEVSQMPPELGMWIQQGLWPDISYVNREYTSLSSPGPPNASTERYSDYSLVMDDEGFNAINFQKDGQKVFNLYLSFYTDEAGNPISAQMELDLRKWRRLKFKFRHASRETPDLGTIYWVYLQTLGIGGPEVFNRAYKYAFGKGTQETSGKSDHDTISDNDWTLIDLLCPEVDENGVVVNLNGWIELVDAGGIGPDPTKIDFLRFFVQCKEPLPGKDWGGWAPGDPFFGKKFVARQELLATSLAGSLYLMLPHPEYFQGAESGMILPNGEKIFYNPNPACLIRDGPGKIEGIEVHAINGPYYPLSPLLSLYNTQITRPLINQYNLTAYVYLLGGWSISLSQIHFERNVMLEGTSPLAPHLQNPKRFKVVTSKEIEYLKEAETRLAAELLSLGVVKQNAEINIDGDPRFLVGYRVWPRMDPERASLAVSVFQDLWMFIDNIEYIIDVIDFKMRVSLGTFDARHGSLNDTDIMASQDRKIRNISQGKTPLTRGVK